jgi:hypothetical protein
MRMNGEVHRHDNRVFVLIVSVGHWLALIALKPFTHRIDRGREVLTGQANYHGAHAAPCRDLDGETSVDLGRFHSQMKPACADLDLDPGGP